GVGRPATTANLGPGFDCLGMALDIWNTVRIEVGASGIDICGEGADTLPRDKSNLIYKAFRRVFQEADRPVPKVRIVSENHVPIARGLGSSTTAVVGGLIAGNEVCGRTLTKTRLLEIATDMEGHPDNAAAAIFGGCRIVAWDGDSPLTAGVPIPPDMRAVVFIPSFTMPTDEARALLPARVDREDAVYNIGRAALLVRAFVTGDMAHLATATEDRLHQPERQTIFPAMRNIFRAALDAGAFGVFLSGAGSSVMALAGDRELTIGYEMADAAAKSGIGGAVKITCPTSRGAHLVENQ
ncbi:MAG: homoserine kinase, partial [Chloroflexi bacterium]|nr:homoserine kinase [Chloroflexota bacterium]